MKHLFMGGVKVYLKLAKHNESMLNKPAPTPYLADDDKDYDEDKEPKGQLQSIAAKVIMNMLYGVKMASSDILHSCEIVACKIAKWPKRCDQTLLIIVSYIHQNIDIPVFGWVGDKSIDWRIWLYIDADFAAGKSTSERVSGVCLL